MDRKLLLAVIEKFSGGGRLETRAAIGEERDTIEDMLEPYLIRQGFRNARRAGVARRAWRHFGLRCRGFGPASGRHRRRRPHRQRQRRRRRRRRG